MANINIVATEPTANEVLRLDIRCDGAGNVSHFNAILQVATDDGGAYFDGNQSVDPGTLSAGELTAVTTLIAKALTDYKAAKGF